MLTRSPMKRTRPKPTIPAALRRQLEARSGGWCEARLLFCTGRATDTAHRNGQKMGGRPGDKPRLSNVLHLCRACHGWCHNRPAEAKDLGLMLEEWQDPAGEPVAYQSNGFVLLDDAGGLWPWGDAA